MRRVPHRLIAVGFVCVLVCSAVGVASATLSPTETVQTRPTTASTMSAQTTDTSVSQTQTYSLVSDRPGQVAVSLTYAIPDRVTSLRTYLPAGVTVRGVDGFHRVNETAFEWDGTTPRATIDVRFDPNRTVQDSRLDGGYLAADTGDWALFSRIGTPTRFNYAGSGDNPLTFDRTVRTAGPGVTGDQLVYLGAVTTTERRANGQRFRLVVPEQADLAEPRSEILDSLANASATFRVGHRDESVLAIAAPTGDIDWGVRGLQSGPADFWVRDSERLDTGENTWIHEYVHTRQTFRTTSQTRWLTEATAVYYGALLSLRQGRITFDEFESTMAVGERAVYDDVVLADPGTWTLNANYVKGPLATGRIDESIRTATDRQTQFEAVLERLNDADDSVTQTAFLTAVERTGGADARSTAASLSGTTAPVSMWNDTVHSRLFGRLPANVDYGLPANATGYRVSGPYRNDSVGTPIQLATGETLTVETVVVNTGDADGAYTATLTVDDTTVDSVAGSIAGDTERVVSLSHTFDSPGQYTLGVGGEQTTVVVEDPAVPTVADLAVDQSSVLRGERVILTATLRNDAAIPANGTVVFTRNGESITERAVTLLPGATTALSAPIALPAAGEISIGAGSATPLTVTVTAPTPTPTQTATAQPTGASGPGFTAVVALLSVVLALVGRRR